jgi:hypothetical protein
VIGKLFSTVGIVATATLLACGAFVGYLVGTGRLNAVRIETIAAVVRGEPVVRSFTSHLTTQPAGDTGLKPVPPTQPAPERSAEDMAALRQREHLDTLRIERALADLEAQRRLLDQVMQNVLTEQERLAKEKAAVNAQKKDKAETALDEGFRRELEIVAGLPPRQAKEHIIRVWRKQKADAVRLFMELEVGRGKRILEQFKTPEELEIQTDLLEQIRSQGLQGYATPSGKTAGAAAP